MATIAQTTQFRTHNGVTAAYTPAVTAAIAARPQGAQAQQTTPPTLPEAPCSVNGYFQVAGYARDFQATGRGTTPAAAAANLRDTITATRSALAPPAPPTRDAQVATLLACGIQKAVQRGDWDRIARLGSAAALVLSGAVCTADMPDRYTVLSRTQEGVAWDVATDGACGCPDYKHRATAANHFYCAHGLSVLLTLRLAETEGVS